MNCKQANEIPLAQNLKTMGCKPLSNHSGGVEDWHENPLREERIASFSVNVKKIYGMTSEPEGGGKVIDLDISYTKSNVKGALEWLENNLGNVTARIPQPFITRLTLSIKTQTMPWTA